MSKVLILAKSGFGKSTSIGEIPELGLKGLDPKTTYLISCVNKPLPFRGANKKFVVTTPNNPTGGNRVITNDAEVVAKIINMLAKSPYKNIVLDDMNYMAQDYYMKNALKGGWDTPKKIGYNTGLVFDAINAVPEDKNIICLAHYEEYKDKNGDSISYKFKTTGKMTDDYITPEGKFDIVIFGKVGYDTENKKVIKHFIKECDGEYPAKDSLGILDDLPDEIPNDLSIVVDKLREIYG